MKTLIMLFVLFAMTLSAADVTGKWKATMETPHGKITRTFTFKQDGAIVTGQTVSDKFGKAKIENGKIEGDVLSFNVTVIFEVGSLKVSFTGKVQGDEIKMTAAASGDTLEFTAKKAP